ncbi:MAG: DUF547 domain-containing protein [Flavobacteriales bacterium]|nr:DUF547 domain-containing protein [Flavobacteriales bacterium]
MLLVSASWGTQPSANPLPTHSMWDALLKKYVSAEGKVNYQAWLPHIDPLKDYLRYIAENPPTSTWSDDEQKAYWINAYNAFTVKLILDNYPVKSINNIGTTSSKPWDIMFIEIGGQKYSLNMIEHEKLRKAFHDPRIHFALNCASKSCPPLLNAAYTANQLHAQLEEQTRAFINDKTQNLIGTDKATISKIFNWYAEDFASSGGVVSFINKYTDGGLKEGATITYQDYNWSLNE